MHVPGGIKYKKNGEGITDVIKWTYDNRDGLKTYGQAGYYLAGAAHRLGNLASSSVKSVGDWLKATPFVPPSGPSGPTVGDVVPYHRGFSTIGAPGPFPGGHSLGAQGATRFARAHSIGTKSRLRSRYHKPQRSSSKKKSHRKRKRRNH